MDAYRLPIGGGSLPVTVVGAAREVTGRGCSRYGKAIAMRIPNARSR
jgi:hypothetical protein